MVLVALLCAAVPAAAQDDTGTGTRPASPFARFLAGVSHPTRGLEAREDTRRRVRKALERFYARRDDEMAWSRSGRVRPAAHELVAALRAAGDQGLDPTAYAPDRLERAIAAADGDRGKRMRLDVDLTAAFLTYGEHLLRGRVQPDDVNPDWYIEPRGRDLAAVLDDALEGSGVAPALAGLAPAHRAYRQLADALARYRRLDAGGGWPQMPDGPVLAAGDPVDPEPYRALIDRLAAEGDLAAADARRLRAAAPTPGPDDRPVVGETLAAAVRRFQRREGLAVDGKVGPATRRAMNVPAADRVAQIEANMERWRWLPDDFGSRYVEVNLADQELVAVDAGAPALRMAVVVGKQGWGTPVFRDRIESVIVNPAWNVPASIARDDLLPRIRRDPGYLARNRFEVLSGWGDDARRVDPASVDWDALAADDLDVHFRQEPGPGNALGQIKFMFPNEHHIYLHDTPAEQLFERSARALSHGCIRLARPLDLAGWVFSRNPDWDEARVRRAIDSGERRRIELDHEIPVYLLYWTAFQGADGEVEFRRDIYGHDRALEAALAG